MIQEWGLEAWGSNSGCDARVLVTDWVSKCGEKVKLVCVECRKKLSPLHMSSSELPHMMLLRVPSERRMKRRRRWMKLTKACFLRVLAANEWISALKLAKIGSCPTYMFCGSSDDMQPIISRLDVHSLGLKTKEKWWITSYSQREWNATISHIEYIPRQTTQEDDHKFRGSKKDENKEKFKNHSSPDPRLDWYWSTGLLLNKPTGSSGGQRWFSRSDHRWCSKSLTAEEKAKQNATVVKIISTRL